MAEREVADYVLHPHGAVGLSHHTATHPCQLEATRKRERGRGGEGEKEKEQKRRRRRKEGEGKEEEGTGERRIGGRKWGGGEVGRWGRR